MGRAPQPRRGIEGTKAMEEGWGHEFLITSEEVGIEGAEAMEEEGWARFFITWEMVGIEGAEATEEGRGTIFE